jgi:hypothetical protein
MPTLKKKIGYKGEFAELVDEIKFLGIHEYPKDLRKKCYFLTRVLSFAVGACL